MSVSKDIKTLVVNTINALSSTQAVYSYNELMPSGWPCVWVTASDLDGSFATTAENRRVYAYRVTAMMTLGQDFLDDSSLQREEYAENVIADVVDDIIDAVDDNTFLDQINDYSSGDATGLFVEAADAQWGEVDMQDGKAKACQITLMIHTDYNFTT